MLRVSESLVRTATYPRKQKTHDRGESISRRRCGRAPTAACAGRSSSWLCRAMLSARSSFIATYCCDLIFWASLAPMGGSADDSTTALSAGGLGQGSRGEARVGAAASEVLAVTDAAVLLEATENNGSPASAAGRGIAPNGEPAEGPTHQVGEQTKLLIRGPIPTTSIHPAQATSLRQLRVPCLQPAWSCHTQGWPIAYIDCWLEHLRLQGLLDRGVVPPLPQVRLLDLSYTGPPAGPAHLAMPQLRMVRLLDRNISYATTATGPPAGPEP